MLLRKLVSTALPLICLASPTPAFQKGTGSAPPPDTGSGGGSPTGPAGIKNPSGRTDGIPP